MAEFRLEKCEQETIINLDDNGDTTIQFDEELPTATLYTANPKWIRKMDKLVQEHPESFKASKCDMYKGKPLAKWYVFPQRFVSIRTKDVKRELTEEQRKDMSERMKARHAAKKPKSE